MRSLTFAALLFAVAICGCRSPYYADRGALLGGLGGAGAGALIGEATGNTAAGAIIGAGVGTIAGAAVGTGLDSIEARNRAQIESQIGRALPTGGVTINDAVAMSQAGIDEELIVNHIRANGTAKRLDANDLIMLQQQGISRNVIAALQTTPPPQPVAVAAAPYGGAPVVVEEHYYGAHPCYGPPPVYRRYYGPPPPPAVGFGFSYSKR